MDHLSATIIFILTILSVIQSSVGIRVEEDLAMTHAEKLALDKFKIRMIPKMPHDYMKTDIYLIRWLRARNLNQEKAEKMLIESLRWRKENNIDTINDEDWSDMTEEFGYSYSINTHDKTGRPIGAANIGTWNIRRAVVTGNMQRLLRLGFKCIEEITQQVIKLQSEGKNVTQWKVLFNVEGFNFIEHACPRCLPLYAVFVGGHEEYYPGFSDQIILINVPPTFKIIIDALVPLVGQRTKNTLRIFGQDAKTWETYLDTEISRDQRFVEMGGTKAGSF